MDAEEGAWDDELIGEIFAALVIMLVVITIGMAIDYFRGPQWPTCECAYPTVSGCSCKRWVDYCFGNFDTESEIKRCIVGEKEWSKN